MRGYEERGALQGRRPLLARSSRLTGCRNLDWGCRAGFSSDVSLVLSPLLIQWLRDVPGPRLGLAFEQAMGFPRRILATRMFHADGVCKSRLGKSDYLVSLGGARVRSQLSLRSPSTEAASLTGSISYEPTASLVGKHAVGIQKSLLPALSEE